MPQPVVGISGVRGFELLQILDLPTHSRQVLEVSDLDQVPLWIALQNAEKKTAMLSGEFFHQFFSQPIPRVFELLKRNRVACHALELIFENHPHVAVAREEDFVDRPIMSRQVAGEAVCHGGGESRFGEHLFYVEEVTWMLTIQYGHDFAAVKFCGRQTPAPKPPL